MDLFGIFGTGGYGREVMPLARICAEQLAAAAEFDVVFVQDYVSDPSSSCNGHRVVSTEEFAAMHVDRKYFNVAVADGKIREGITERLRGTGAMPFAVRSSQSVVLDGNIISEGAILCAFTTITSNVRIGRFFHANLYSYVGHDCSIGDFVTFAPSVHCNGNVVVEDHAYLGTGALIKQGHVDNPLTIGKGAIVGMGAVVTRDVEPFTTVIGNPARVLPRK